MITTKRKAQFFSPRSIFILGTAFLFLIASGLQVRALEIGADNSNSPEFVMDSMSGERSGNQRAMPDSDFSELSSEELISIEGLDYEPVEYLGDESFVDYSGQTEWSGGSVSSSTDNRRSRQNQEDFAWEEAAGRESVSLSVGEVLEREAMEKKWGAVREEIEGVGKSVRNAVEDKVDGARQAIGSGTFGSGGDFSQQRQADYSGAGSMEREGMQDGRYSGENGVPVFYQWFYRIIRFKNDNPVAFYGLLATAVILLLVQSLVVGVMRRNRRVV